MVSVKDYCRGKRVNIYGAGNWGRLLAVYLLELGIEVESFLVSFKTSNKDCIVLGIPVRTFDNDFTKKGNLELPIIVAVGSRFRDEIIHELEKEDIKDYYVLAEGEIEEIAQKVEYKRHFDFENNINVVLYHRVANLPIDPRKLSIPPERLEMHLKYFKKHFSVIRTDEEWSRKDKCLAITFDDGHYDFCSNVVPLLEKYETPATVFVTTGIIDKEAELWGDELERIIYINDYRDSQFTIWGQKYSMTSDEERFDTMIRMRNMLKNMPTEYRKKRMDELAILLDANMKPRITHRIMTAEEIKKCSKSPFVTIGAHTVTHCSLAHESRERQLQEIKESKEALEEIIEKAVTVFAYPYGEEEDFTEDTISIANDLGFTKIFAVGGGMTNRRFVNGRIPRNNVSFCKTEKEMIRQLQFLTHIYGDALI